MLLQLVADGTIGLDDPVVAHAADLTIADGVTIRQLLAHRSGIAEHLDGELAPAVLADPARSWTPADVIDLVVDQPRDFPPGAAVRLLEHQLHRRRAAARKGHGHDPGRQPPLPHHRTARTDIHLLRPRRRTLTDRRVLELATRRRHQRRLLPCARDRRRRRRRTGLDRPRPGRLHPRPRPRRAPRPSHLRGDDQRPARQRPDPRRVRRRPAVGDRDLQQRSRFPASSPTCSTTRPPRTCSCSSSTTTAAHPNNSATACSRSSATPDTPHHTPQIGCVQSRILSRSPSATSEATSEGVVAVGYSVSLRCGPHEPCSRPRAVTSTARHSPRFRASSRGMARPVQAPRPTSVARRCASRPHGFASSWGRSGKSDTGANGDGDDGSDNPVDGQTERRPPAGAGDEVGPVLPQVFEPVAGICSDE